MIKYDTYIAVFEVGSDKTTAFVTDIDKHTASWESGKEAMRFSEEWARDVVYGLILNGYIAGIVKFPHGVTVRNPERSEQ
jgi:hypothetical protein